MTFGEVIHSPQRKKSPFTHHVIPILSNYVIYFKTLAKQMLARYDGIIHHCEHVSMMI